MLESNIRICELRKPNERLLTFPKTRKFNIEYVSKLVNLETAQLSVCIWHIILQSPTIPMNFSISLIQPIYVV